MMPSVDYRFAAMLFARCMSLLICLTNSLIVVGWFADVHILKDLIPGQSVIPANCALGWAVAAAALFLLCTKIQMLRWCGLLLALLMTVTSVFTLYGGVVNQDLDWLVIQSSVDAVPVEIPGQMLFQESVPFMLIGCSLLLVEARRRWFYRLAAIFAVLAMLPAAQSLLGYATGNSELFTFCTANECARLHIFLVVVNILFCLTLLVKPSEVKIVESN